MPPNKPPIGGCDPYESAEFTRGEVDRAGINLFEKRDVHEAERVIKLYRKFRVNCLNTSLSILESAKLPKRCAISARLKRMQSIYRKLMRSKNPKGLGNMDDIIGFRVICETYEAALELSKRICSLPEHIKLKSYLDGEHYLKTGYRASHHIMRFEQPKQDQMIRVRFEIQVRTYYQHCWAVWSESHGEQAKEGFGRRTDSAAKKQRQHFLDISRRIAAWEEANPSKVQGDPLPNREGILNLAVVWNLNGTTPRHLLFHEDIEAAVDFLNYLEGRDSNEIQNVLMLVGVSSDGNLISLLQKTHPRFVYPQAELGPENWMPAM